MRVGWFFCCKNERTSNENLMSMFQKSWFKNSGNPLQDCSTVQNSTEQYRTVHYSLDKSREEKLSVDKNIEDNIRIEEVSLEKNIEDELIIDEKSVENTIERPSNSATTSLYLIILL